MWSSRLFWKLFVAFAGLNVAAAVAFVMLVSGQQSDEDAEQVQRRLQDAALVLRHAAQSELAEGNSRGLARLARRVSDETGLRVTIFDADEETLADSNPDDGPRASSQERFELRQASSEGIGRATRLSPTLGTDVNYLAVRVDEQGRRLGYVRVAAPVDVTTDRSLPWRRAIWTVFLLVVAADLAVTYWAVARIIRPIATLTAGAQAIVGDDDLQQVLDNQDELRTLGAAFDRMTRELATRITQLRQNGERLATVLGAMVEGVVAVDDQHRILFANGAARALLDFVTPDTEGRPLVEAVRIRAVHEAVDEAFDREEPCASEFEIAGKTRRVVAVHATRLPGEPCPGVVLVLHDVTELRRLENLRQEFVANVSHELKTPLTSIKAYAETLLDGALEDRANNVTFVRRIGEQAERLYQLILDLLSIARIESGQASFEIGSVSLAAAVDGCVAQHLARAEAKQIQLVVEPPPSAIRVHADEEGLRQILDNLIDNAIKYTSEGGRVTLRWHSEGTAAVLEVEDTGIGIAPEAQARIFERFYRADKARSREVGGTGLGLAIVKHLVQAFGGTVSVTSKLGEGTKFTVRLTLDFEARGAARADLDKLTKS